MNTKGILKKRQLKQGIYIFIINKLIEQPIPIQQKIIKRLNHAMPITT